jgi:hypothetical protein
MASQEHPVACGVCLSLSQGRPTTTLGFAVVVDGFVAFAPIVRYGRRLPEPQEVGAIGSRTIEGRPVVVARGRARFAKGHGGGPLRTRCDLKHRVGLSQAAAADAFRRLGPGETLYFREA